MKKRILTAILCGAVILSCAGCGQREKPTEQDQNNSALIQTEEKTNTSVPDTSNPAESQTPQTDTPNEIPNDVTASSQETPVSTPKHDNPSEKPQEKETSKPTQPSTPTQPVKQPDSPYIRPDADEVARKTAEYINKLRKEQGSTTTVILPGLTEVAKFRSKQLITDFSHESNPDACTALKYGEFVDMTELGYSEEYNYYRGYNREAAAKGNWTGTADEIAQKIANGFKTSKGHWAYVGSSEYGYMAVGITFNPSDSHREVENLVRESFWNVYRPGCTEHYILNQLRKDADFVPELDFVMEQNGTLIGQIAFVRSEIKADDGKNIPIMTMGPICITPMLKRKGYGKILLDYSLEKAKELGCGEVCLEGNIEFYGKSGFQYASKFGIRHHEIPDGEDASFFLCKELIPAYLDGITGEYATPQGYFVDEKDIQEFDKSFPHKEKLKLPGQIF